MGSMKGKMLSTQVEKIHQEFLDTVKVFAERTYNALDPQCQVCITLQKENIDQLCGISCSTFAYLPILSVRKLKDDFVILASTFYDIFQ